MESSDRTPGSWEKTPSERLAASRERSQRRSQKSPAAPETSSAEGATRCQGAPHAPRTGASRTPAPRTSTLRPAAPRTSPSRGGATRGATQRHTSHTSSANAARTARPTERPRQTSTATASAPQEPHVVRVGGVDFSVRLLFVFILLGLLIALVAPSVFQWLRQEQDRQEILAELEAAKAKQSQIERELKLWENPEYIASQARERLGFVKPGETQYSVIDPGPGYQDVAQVAAAASKGPQRPWMQKFVLLTSLADSTEELPATQHVLHTPTPEQDAQSGEAQSGQSDATPPAPDGEVQPTLEGEAPEEAPAESSE